MNKRVRQKVGGGMEEWFSLIEHSNSIVKLKINNISKLDISMFEKMDADQFCIKCLFNESNGSIITYSVSNLITLDDFLSQVVFEQEDGFIFSIHFFESLIASHRNKPIVLDTKLIYVNSWGTEFYFLALPLSIDQWIYQQNQLQEFIMQYMNTFRCCDDYQLVGYMFEFLKSKEFSLANLVQGLRNVLSNKQSVRFDFSSLLRKKKTSFSLKQPIYPQMQWDLKIQEENVENYKSDVFEKTQLIGEVNRSSAYLMYKDQKYDLISEDTIVGRSMACDIRILQQDVSLKHAKIVCDNNRYYLQDLKSANGTFLGEKRVQRRMRLKNGMQIRFGLQEFIFYQNEHGKV